MILTSIPYPTPTGDASGACGADWGRMVSTTTATTTTTTITTNTPYPTLPNLIQPYTTLHNLKLSSYYYKYPTLHYYYNYYNYYNNYYYYY